MKRPAYIILCISAALAATGCTGNHTRPVVARENICFNVAVNPNTRADASPETSYPEDVPFAVWAFDEEGAAVLDNTPSEPISEGYWQPQGGMLWPEDGSELMFCALSPYGRGSYVEGKGIVYEDYDIAEGIDLLYTGAMDSRGQTWSHGIVPLDFRHALATVRFSARAQFGEEPQLTIRRITLEGIATCGSFASLPSARWTSLGKYGTRTVFEGSATIGETRVVIDKGTYQIPQEGAVTVKVLFDFVNGGSSLTGQEIEAEVEMNLGSGKVTQYLLTINRSFDLSIEKDNA